ncbi:hypothetical protein F0562_027114 [Nyssa sinensis]|uniref:Kinesin motor domain-containing protein n=1 Tax=Nyssa sinensis TaxID=561372 RepID=A0A5J5B5H1_9ASTE|nr:hypothetical protein F0562_027114 [Nyssa sinensis]
MEMKSPPPCPTTVTVRRNPPRKARATPSTIVPLPMPLSSSIPQDIPSFPIQDILSIEVPQNPNSSLSTSLSAPSEDPIAENLKVFLRIRPLNPLQSLGKQGKIAVQTLKSRTKNAWPQNPTTKNTSKTKIKKKSENCITVNDSHSVTLCPPPALQDSKRVKSEVYEGFSHVFNADSSQDEVYEKMVDPLVEDFIKGKSGMLAALGPSGSGKTHTVFGCPREPGMLPLALRRIFSRSKESGSQLSRSFSVSMFEIYSERGKAERMFDLFQDGGDLFLQQSTIKGLQEVIISDVQEAESLIACGMLKRATAMTNSNNQSSRSQCIINIRSAPKKIDGEVDLQSKSAVLTIVDLAGAEREKRTGNQGTRLLESNFINNTSMVFDLCLRSLLEYQKNPKKTLQKHFQSSLLTRYLRDYLEGKKRMTLILTVKPGEEDYLDASVLLRQASPYMKIKFNNVEDSFNSLCNKRNFQTTRTEQLKRMKYSGLEACVINEGKGVGGESQLQREDIVPGRVKEVEPQKVLGHSPRIINLEANDSTSVGEDYIELAKRERKNQVMQNMAKALWNVLKQYKNKLEVAENEIHSLRECLANEKALCSDLENKLKILKSCCSCREAAVVSPVKVDEPRTNIFPKLEGCQSTDLHEVKAGVLNLKDSESINSEQRSEATGTSGVAIASCLDVENFDDLSNLFIDQKCERFPGIDNAKDLNDSEDVGRNDAHSDGVATDSGLSESVISSSQSLVIVRNDSCSSTGEQQSLNEKDKKCLDQLAMPEEDVLFAQECNVSDATESKLKLVQGCNVSGATESEPKGPKLISHSKPLSSEKPKRRLLPASSILLKDIGTMDLEDENEKPKGTRGERKWAVDESKRTQGSITLLRLLRSNLHQ